MAKTITHPAARSLCDSWASCLRSDGILFRKRTKNMANMFQLSVTVFINVQLSFWKVFIQILKHACCVYVRPLLEFSTQIWSPCYKYLTDKVESVQRYLTKRLSGLSELSYRDGLGNVNLQSLECRLLVYDLVFFCCKILHGSCEVSLPVVLSCGNNLKLAKHFCYTMTSANISLTKKRLRRVNLHRFMTML